MRIHKLDLKNNIISVCDWPAPFGKILQEVQVGQFIFINAYICSDELNKVTVSFDRLLNLMPSIVFDKNTRYRRCSQFKYVAHNLDSRLSQLNLSKV